MFCSFTTVAVLALLFGSTSICAADEVRIANPVLPDTLADPSVIHHEGIYYLFATKDPWGGDDLACHATTDFITWEPHRLNWPTNAQCESPTRSPAKVWAPEVIRGRDGRFYLYVSVGGEIYCGVASHPTGPWSNVTGGSGPIIFSQEVEGIHTIDASPFIDSDGRVYLYWGSGLNWQRGECLAVELENDMHTFAGKPKKVTPPRYLEAPHMIKRDGKYYLMYSDGRTIDKSYKLRYAVGDGPFGPFSEEGEHSPILQTNEERRVWGPGHHCVFKIDGQDYVAYHRHKRPYSTQKLLRQVCFDRLLFDDDGWINKITPTDAGITLGGRR